jgi:glycosyltransferase involved in cell wall biosynthesis
MKKLAIFSEGDIRFFGGAEKYSIELSNSLQNFDITIFTYKNSKFLRLNSEQVNKLTKAKIIYYNAIQFKGLSERIPISISALRVFLMLKNFEVVYNIDPSLLTNFFLLGLSRIYKFKFIFGAHDPNFVIRFKNDEGLFKKLIVKIYMPLKNNMIRHMSNIHVLNGDGKKLLSKMGFKNKVYIIPNFLSNKVKLPKSRKNKEFIVLYVGRIEIDQKGIDYLAKIINETLKKDKKIYFHIVGTGDQSDQKLIKDIIKIYPRNVEYLGFINKQELEKEYDSASLLIITSRYETQPAVLMEAQAHGLPFLGFNVYGVRNFLKKNFQGKLIDPYNVKFFSDAILKYSKLFYEKPLEYNKLKLNVYYFTNETYSKDLILEKMQKMFLD